VHNTLLAGYIPIITHPERLAYIEADYDKFVALAEQGAWIQLTGGSLLGRFGPRVKRITERFLSDGVTHLLASDGHNLKNRTPELSEARDAAADIIGTEAASLLVLERPAAVIANTDPADVPQPRRQSPTEKKKWFSRLFG
ncbi:MAG: capsular biosynthesis protein, partial [Proteobacteria bacterium]|nr:capsular biosynthesis protein [Pseudomonadota bacterium]